MSSRGLRRNADEGLRRLEREVAETGSPDAIARLIVARLRSGAITQDAVRWAEFFSRPISSAGGEGGNWAPVTWWLEQESHPTPNLEGEFAEDVARSLVAFRELSRQGRFVQDTRLVAVREALSLVGVLPWLVSDLPGRANRRLYLPPEDPPVKLHDWSLRRGFLLSDTGGDYNHPPLEVQWTAEPEMRRERTAQRAAFERYSQDRPDGWTEADEGKQFDNRSQSHDDIAHYEVRREAFAGDDTALRILAWLRLHSTLNYFEVLSLYACTPLWNRDADFQLRPGAIYRPYGQVEYELVGTLLGGAPLGEPPTRMNTDAQLRTDDRAFRAAPTIEGGLALARAYQRAGDNPAAYETLSATLDAVLRSSYGILRKRVARDSPETSDQLGAAIIETWAVAPIAADGEPRYMGKYFLNDIREISPTAESAFKRLFGDIVEHITKFWVDHGQQVLPRRLRPKRLDLVRITSHDYSERRRPGWQPEPDKTLDDLGLNFTPEIRVRALGSDWMDIPLRGAEVSRLHDEAMKSVSDAFHGTRVEWERPSHEYQEDPGREHSSPSQSDSERGSQPFTHVAVVGRYRVSLDQGFMKSLAERFGPATRPNSDKRLRALERAWRTQPGDWKAADAYAVELVRTGQPEEADNVVRLSGPAVVTLDLAIHNSIWRSGEVMNSRNPAEWFYSGPIGRKQIAEMILSTNAGSVEPPVAIVEALVPAPRPCFDPRHGEPCVYDACAGCAADGCDVPNLPVYTRKLAAAFVVSDRNFMAIGVRAVPLGDPRPGRIEDPIRAVFGDWIGTPLEIMDRAQTLEHYRQEVVDTEEVRVYDNGGRTADRFTILMSYTPRNALGRTDDSETPQYLTVAANSQPSHPQYGFWMHTDSGFDPDDPGEVGQELAPWPELLPRETQDALWAERGHAIIKVPREVAVRWADLVLTGRLND